MADIGDAVAAPTLAAETVREKSIGIQNTIITYYCVFLVFKISAAFIHHVSAATPAANLSTEELSPAPSVARERGRVRPHERAKVARVAAEGLCS